METGGNKRLRFSVAPVLLMVNDTGLSNTTLVSAEDVEKLSIPLYVLVLIIVGLIFMLVNCYCFFCMPSKNKRKIYAMMQEAKLEEEG